MLIHLFKSNQRILGILIPVWAILIWIPGVFIDSIFIGDFNININKLGAFFAENKAINISLTAVLIAAQGLYLNFIISKQKLFKANNFLIAFFYVLLNGCSSIYFSINLIIISNIFLLLALSSVLNIYNQTTANSLIFNSSLYIGLAAFFYPPAVLFFLIVWIGLSYLRTPKIKDYLVALIGLLVPYVYISFYFFMTNRFNIENNSWLFYPSVFKKATFTQENQYVFSLILIVLGLALIHVVGGLSRSVVKTRKQLIVILLFGLIACAILFFNGKDVFAVYQIITIPAAVLLGNLFTNLKKRWISEILFLMMLIAILLPYFL